ncbi:MULTISPECIES: FAD-binding oxidoreductase [Actinomadura]|uniref:FAD-binding oxidoreductase n=1 Tax=Actinomadura yumaensis TaxID=111807 RepID=A0ABW2D159_9ACTN|nr:FAD-binding oxidoreductase [Actinomadura sp. J1-007]MWK36968.1 FAD-binding protein [Actinomadura sp. J1-007]
MPSLNAASAAALGRVLHGPVLRPGDAGYDAARRVWNGRIDRRPGLIARCAGAADVAAAVRFAREGGLELSVRGTGHNVTGRAVTEGGLMIDLSGLAGVRVDPGRRRVQAQAGVTWALLDHETQAFGLATTGGRISTTGVGGLTLGGGYGWLMRQCGLTVDNVLAVDLVTADGRAVTADETGDPDLFWALRGGGGNFGIATGFEFALHEIGPRVLGGAAFYPAAQAAEVLRTYRDLMAGAPDELAAQCNFLLAPPAPFVPAHLHGTPIVAIAVCHTGDAERARHDLARLKGLGEPLVDRIKPMRYTTLQRLYDVAGRFGSCVHGRSGHLPLLGDGAIEVLARQAVRLTSPLSIVMISALGGAVARVGEAATAFGHRRVAFSYSIDSVWTRPDEERAAIRWADDLWTALLPFSEGVYVNELGDEGEERVRAAYLPESYARLASIKRRYDPDNVFHLNQNIRPA